MGVNQFFAVAAAGLLIATSLSSCHVKNDPAAYDKAQEKTFLDILSGPLRDKYSDADLIAEGHKACEAFSQGKSSDQVADMVEADLKLDPGYVGQFMGGISAAWSATTGPEPISRHKHKSHDLFRGS